jgi:hypothetical protein
MRQPKERPPIPFLRLCGIAKATIKEWPTMDNFEWQEAIKTRLLKQEFTYPEDPSAIHRAMSQVERAQEKQWGPRPPPAVTPSSAPASTPEAPASTPEAPPVPFTPEEARTILATVTACCGTLSPPCVQSSQNNSGGPGTFTALREVLWPPEARPPAPSLQVQIDTERSSHWKPRHIRTATGWIRVDT